MRVYIYYLKRSIAPLRIDDTKLVTSEWKYSDQYTEERILKCIKDSISSGLRDDKDNLISWSLLRDGCIGNVHTLSTYTRKGYSTLIVIDLCDKIKKANIIPMCDIVIGNKASGKHIIYKIYLPFPSFFLFFI